MRRNKYNTVEISHDGSIPALDSRSVNVIDLEDSKENYMIE